jgi:hypothetical protein
MVEIPVEIISSGYSYTNINIHDLTRSECRQTDSRVGVDGLTVNVEVVLGQDLGALVNGATGTIKDTTKHVLGHTKLQRVSTELDFGLRSRYQLVWFMNLLNPSFYCAPS